MRLAAPPARGRARRRAAGDGRGPGRSVEKRMAEESTSTRPEQQRVAELLSSRRDEILNLWITERLESDEFRDELISKKELLHQSRQVLEMLAQALRESDGSDFDHPSFADLRAYLNEISHMRAVKGYTPTENATYVLALRNVTLPLLAEELEGSADALIR